MQTLKEWHNSQFFKHFKPFRIITEDGKRIDVKISDFGNYNVVSTAENNDRIFVTVQRKGDVKKLD